MKAKISNDSGLVLWVPKQGFAPCFFLNGFKAAVTLGQRLRFAQIHHTLIFSGLSLQV